jgi:hypothetical protein
MSVSVTWGDDAAGGVVEGTLDAMGVPSDTLPHMWWLRVTSPDGIPAIIQIPQGMEGTVHVEALS